MMELLRSRNLGTQQYCLPLKRDLTFVEAKNTSYQSLTDRRPVLKNVSFQSIYQYVLVDDKNKVLRGSKLNQRIIEKSFSKNSLSQKACRSLPLQLIEKILAYLSSAELVRLFMPLHNQHINPLKLAVGHSLQKKLLGQNHVQADRALRRFAELLNSINKPKPSNQLTFIDIETIQLDAQRTFTTGHSQHKLFQLLVRLCRTTLTNYIQGMNYIAAHALKQTNNEQDAYRLCIYLIVDMQYRDTTADGLKGIMKLNRQIDEKLRRRLPTIAKALDKHGLDVSLLTTEWFMTLFVRIFSNNTANKIWLLFAMEGWKVLTETAWLLIQILLSPYEKKAGCQQVFMNKESKILTAFQERTIMKQLQRRMPLRNSDKIRSIRSSIERRPGISLCSSIFIR